MTQLTRKMNYSNSYIEKSRKQSYREVIILENLNKKTEAKLGDKVLSRTGENATNDNGLRLIQLRESDEKNELKIMNGIFSQPCMNKYTWT